MHLSTYAAWWSRRAILDALAGSGVIRMRARAGRQLAAVTRAEAELERGVRHHASDAEIAQRAALSATAVRSVRTAAHVTASLHAPVGEGAASLGNIVADERAVDPSSREPPKRMWMRGSASRLRTQSARRPPPASVYMVARSSAKQIPIVLESGDRAQPCSGGEDLLDGGVLGRHACGLPCRGRVTGDAAQSLGTA
jgi:hypothetical protein